MGDVRIPLSSDRVAQLRRLAEESGSTVEDLGRRVVEEWLDAATAEAPDRARARLGALLDRRSQVASERGVDPSQAERDVNESVRDVRRRAKGSR